MSLNTFPVLSPIEQKIVDCLPLGAKDVLVVGCDDGRLAEGIRDKCGRGGRLVGIEPHPALAQGAAGKFDHVVCAEPDAVGVQELGGTGRFDVIVYSDLGRYVGDPLGTWRRQLERLSPDGTLIAAFRNGQFAGRLGQIANTGLLQDFLFYYDISEKYPYTYNIVVRMMATFRWVPSFIFGTVSAQYQQWKEDQEKPVELGRLKFTFQNELDAFVMTSYQMLLSARRGEGAETAAPNVQFRLLTLDDFRASMYRHPPIFWEKVGPHFVDMERASVNIANRMDANAAHVAQKVIALEPAPKSILHVGCGYGRVLKALRAASADVRLVGLEACPGQLERARDFLADADVELVHYEKQDDAMPFDDSSFDVVLSAGALSSSYVDYMNHLRREMWRVASHFVVHDEDMRPDDPRVIGHDLQTLYAQEGRSIVLAEEDSTGLETQKLHLLAVKVS